MALFAIYTILKHEHCVKLVKRWGRFCEVKKAEETWREDLFFDPGDKRPDLHRCRALWLLLEICILSISVYQTWSNSEIWMVAKHNAFFFEAVYPLYFVLISTICVYIFF